jgi:hypothetical protein
VLRHGRKALIQEELQTVVISPDEEAAAPEVRPPMPHCLDQPDELPLVGRQLAMARSKWPAEEGQGAGPLVQYRAKTRA